MNNEQATIQEGDLLAYLAGTASAAMARRIEQSPELLAEAATLRLMDAGLSVALDPDEAISTDELLLYQAGLLSPAEARLVEQHLAERPALRALLTALELPDEDVTPGESAPAERLRAAGRRIIEALRLALPQQPATALRGQKQRSYVYQAGEYRIVLALIPPLLDEAIWQIEGQISPAGAQPIPVGASVQARRADETVAGDQVDEAGFFALDQLGPGDYRIRIDLAEASVLLDINVE
jgi:anti-sigma factor RsiW